MVTESMTASEVLDMYREDVYKLAEFLPWLEAKCGQAASSIYNGDGVADHSVSFPVYDSNLMRFLKVAESTSLMDRNYRYVYTRNGLHDYRDEIKFIDNANILQMAQLGGILSNYVMGGRTRSRLWNDGMVTGVFYRLVKKSKELIDLQINTIKVKGE